MTTRKRLQAMQGVGGLLIIFSALVGAWAFVPPIVQGDASAFEPWRATAAGVILATGFVSYGVGRSIEWWREE